MTDQDVLRAHQAATKTIETMGYSVATSFDVLAVLRRRGDMDVRRSDVMASCARLDLKLADAT